MPANTPAAKPAKSPKSAKTARTKLRASLNADPKDRRGDFIRLAEGRAYNAIKAIQLIGNLSNTNGYEYTEGDVAQILDAIKQELQATEARFKVAIQRASRKAVKLS